VVVNWLCVVLSALHLEFESQNMSCDCKLDIFLLNGKQQLLITYVVKSFNQLAEYSLWQWLSKRWFADRCRSADLLLPVREM